MEINFSKASRRNTQAHWVGVFGVNILFSYQTAIAVSYRDVRVRRNNDWGPTTGRHMNDANVRDWKVIDDEREFEKLVDTTVLSALSDRVSYKLAA